MKRLGLSILLIITATHSFAETRSISGSTVFGCVQKSDLDELTDYLIDQDMAAFKSGLKEKYSSGLCMVFSNGDKVYLVEATFGGLAKVRKQGQTKAYWIDSSGLN